MLAVLAASRLIAGSWSAWGAWLGHLYEDGTAYAVAAAGLLYQPTFMDILPQYIVYLLIAPAVLYLVATKRLWLVAALSLGAWLLVQLGAHLPLVGRVEAALWYGHTDLVLRAHFNPLAWQIVFVPGIAIGALMARGEFVPSRLFSPERTDLLRLALSVLLFFLAWRLALMAGWVDTTVLLKFQSFERRDEFGPVYLLSFVAASYALAWLVVAGPRSTSAAARAGAHSLSSILHHPWVLMLGRNALAVYAFHVVVVYGMKLLDWQLEPLGDPWTSLLGLAAVASLMLPALIGERMKPTSASAAAPAR